MNTPNDVTKVQTKPKTISNAIFVLATLVLGTLALAIWLLAVQAGTGISIMQIISNFFGLDSVHVWWYITRASGLMAYLLVWLSTLWGFAISSKIFDSFLERMFTYDFHEQLSLLSLGFVVLHVVVLMLDKVQPMSLVEILIPFVSNYRPFWTGIGIITFYISILVTVTFYIRSWISMKAFRTIHYLSVASYVGALFHGLFAGTDSALTWTQMMYWGTFLSTVFFCVYWVVTLRLRKANPDATRQIQTQHKS
jgi:predicted ferric reductase